MTACKGVYSTRVQHERENARSVQIDDVEDDSFVDYDVIGIDGFELDLVRDRVDVVDIDRYSDSDSDPLSLMDLC